MESIFKQRTRERITVIADLSHATQGTSKGINKYVRELRKSGGLGSEGAHDINDFLRDFGGGL
jgi:hypothetical protein